MKKNQKKAFEKHSKQAGTTLDISRPGPKAYKVPAKIN
jgi:hypothetical protein